ncbi:MAG: NAD(P)/FAD-dependent oxidoreductase [Dehalococcoidia bacterium]|nr:NAD(P)/FAD-dependent oxidoreductase [Dehalococcoidia bacterium]
MRCDLVIRDPDFEITVVGSGPNGLSAAISLAQKGLRVMVIEGSDSIGGGARTSDLSLAGFRYDEGAAVMPMAIASPFFTSLPLADRGLQWVTPSAALAHPFDDGTAALLTKSIVETGETLGGDAAAYKKLMYPLAADSDKLYIDLLGTMRRINHPLADTRLAFKAFNSAAGLASRHFKESRARGFFAGLAAHSVLPLNMIPSAAIGIIMCLTAHSTGWPIPSGGAGSLTAALAKYFIALGGKIVTGQKIEALTDLPHTEAVFFDTSPARMLKIYEDRFPAAYRKSLQNYRYGPGIFKLDWALSGPIPWKAQECLQAGTVHLGSSLEEIAEAELATWQGKAPLKPFVILAQPSLFDPSRTPTGKHIAWAYCHVPNGCNDDMTAHIESQVERFAPGFRDIILARRVSTPAILEKDNPNLVGGDIVGGAQTLRQTLCRPACRVIPYETPVKGVYLCSASTPPGAGVHGMCGFHAAAVYLKRRRLCICGRG